MLSPAERSTLVRDVMNPGDFRDVQFPGFATFAACRHAVQGSVRFAACDALGGQVRRLLRGRCRLQGRRLQQGKIILDTVIGEQRGGDGLRQKQGLLAQAVEDPALGDHRGAPQDSGCQDLEP